MIHNGKGFWVKFDGFFKSFFGIWWGLFDNFGQDLIIFSKGFNNGIYDGVLVEQSILFNLLKVD